MSQSNIRILVVDDSPITVRKLSMMLTGLGYSIAATAASGQEAIEQYRNCTPDIVTMDITMPTMNGIEATREIIHEFPDARIIMVTSLGQEKMVLDALKAGAKGYVIKPFKEAKISEAIHKVCS